MIYGSQSRRPCYRPPDEPTTRGAEHGSLLVMNVVIDVDETITAAPTFFAWLCAALRRDGHRVVILTVRRDREDTAQELARLGLAYDSLETPPPEVSMELSWKIARATELAPDVIFDDSTDVANAMGPGTLALVPRDPELGRLDYVEEMP